MNLTKYIYLIMVIFLISCNKTETKLTKILPMNISGNKKISEKHITKDFELISEFNNNHKLKDWVFAKYKDGLIIKRFSYENSLFAYSEYSISHDITQKSEESYFKYSSNKKTVILSTKEIFVIEKNGSTVKNKDIEKILNIKAGSDIKFPDGKHKYILESQKILINDDDTFPFLKQYIQRDHIYKDIRVTSIRAYKSNNELKTLEEFIKKQNIIEDNDKATLFSLKDDAENKFLWIKKDKLLLLNFSDNEVENLSDF